MDDEDDELMMEDELIATADSHEKPLKRSGHVSVSIGKMVLVWGGYMDPGDDDNDDNELVLFGSKYMDPDDVWLYHCELNRWQLHKPNGFAPVPLSGAGATFVQSQCSLYITCGFSFSSHRNDTYILDTTSWMWHVVSIEDDKLKPSPRDKFSTWEYQEKVYIFGGYGPKLHPYLHDNGLYFFDSTFQFNPDRGWNNQLLVLDTDSLTWTNPPCSGCVPSPRAAHGSARIGQTVYLFGGRHDTQRLNDLYSLDLTSLCWTQISMEGEMPLGRSWHTFTPVSDCHIFLFGGFSTQQVPLSDAWLYDVVNHTWKEKTSGDRLPRLWHTTAATSDGDIVIFGGCTSDILSQPPVHTNNVSVYRITPQCLLRLSLEAVYKYRDLLEPQWSDLPRTLEEALLIRLHGFTRTNNRFVELLNS